MFSTRSEAKHTELRRKMKAGYDGKENERLEPEIDESIDRLVQLVDREYAGKKAIDFATVMQYWSMDTVGRLAFAQELGDCKDNKDNFGFITAVRESLPNLVALSSFPEVHNWLEKSRMVDLIAPSAKDNMGLGRITGIIQGRVAERYGPDAKDEKDMLGSFVRHGLTQEEAESEAMLLILAGSDTTVTTLRAMFLHLNGNPSALFKLQSEIDNAVASNALSSPAQESETRKLPYLQACIREGLRIWPPVVGLLEKVVPPEGDTFKTVYLPGKTHIGYNGFAIQRDSSVFGDDADLYRPERWLEADAGELIKMERSNDLVFGSGRFECAGKRVAMVEMQKVSVELLRRYDFAVVYPEKPWISACYGPFLQKGMWMKIAHRERQ